MEAKDYQSPIWASVSAVTKAQPVLTELPHVVNTINGFVDVTLDWSLAQAVSFNSHRALQRVATRHDAILRSAAPSSSRVKCFRQQHFSGAMQVAAEHGYLETAQWVRNVYFQEGKVVGAVDRAIQHAHADMLAWLLDTLPVDVTMDTVVLENAVRRGDQYIDVVRVLSSRWPSLPQRYRDNQQFTFASGYLQMAKVLYHIFGQRFDSAISMQDAALFGKIDTMLWLHEMCREPFTATLFTNAVSRGQLEVAQYLHSHYRELTLISNDVLNVAASNGHSEMLEWLYNNRNESTYFPQWGGYRRLFAYWFHGEVVNRYWDVGKWMYAHHFDCTPKLFWIAAGGGNMPMLQWLMERYRHVWEAHKSQLDMSYAATNGRLDVIQWLYANGCRFTDQAVNEAATKGHLPIIKWLHERQPEIFTAKAMDNAAQNGHLDIVQFLHIHQSGNCTTKAMDQAARQDHIEIVRFLHENRSEGCTTDAMDYTRSVKVLEFLNQNRTEGYTDRAYKNAALRGNVEVLEWLYRHNCELVNLDRVQEIARYHLQYHVVYWVDAVKAGELQ